jgi:AbiV family abortive infection protein
VAEGETKSDNDQARSAASQLVPLDVQAARKACLTQAADLLNAARALRSDLPHLAFVLATFALEEVGKAELVALSDIAKVHEESEEEEDNWPARQLDVHVRKLFWAIWSPTFAHDALTRDRIEEYQHAAGGIYNARLASLYVDVVRDKRGVTSSDPRSSLSEEQVDHMLGLADARLRLAQAYEFTQTLDPEAERDLAWYIKASRDRESLKYILSNASMLKLAEVGTRPWMHWLREEFEKADATAARQAQHELERPTPQGAAAEAPKWRIKVRLYTNSHSIRPKALNRWNEWSQHIKLYPVQNRKQELLADFTIYAMFPALRLWDTGLLMVRRFLTAINIGSAGFFWWYMPSHTSRYYEEMRDLETDDRLDVKPEHPVSVQWPHAAVLSEGVLKRTAILTGALPMPTEVERQKPFTHYMTGLALASKNDIHLRIETSIFREFYVSLKTGMHTYGAWDGVAPFKDAFNKVIEENLPLLAPAREEYFGIGEALAGGADPAAHPVTLENAFILKNLCDVFFFQVLEKLARAKVESLKAERAAAQEASAAAATPEGQGT